MKTKFNGILTLLLALVVHFSFAQERIISGTVSDESGPLPGVNVLKKGTSSGTETDFDGKYSIKAKNGDILVFSFVGMKTVERTVGASSNISFTMESDNVLEEVVVTALGISKSAKSLGYATDVIKSEELVKARESNIINSLQGKVTGVKVTSSGGNLGGSSNIIVRGVTSLSGRNNPLFIVDGVILNNQQTAGNGDRITGNRDFANGAATINPDDVESMNVLKGAAATALYGSRAAAGVIIITTKRGRKGQGGPTVSFNSSLRFDELFRTPNYQNEYAMGFDGKYNSNSTNDWGPRIVGQTVPNLPITGLPGALTSIEDNGVNEFFNTGVTAINNFSIADADEKLDYRLSLTALNQTGILPGAELDRYTFNFNAGVKHNDKLQSRFTVQYTKTESTGTGAVGANDPNIVSLATFSNSVDPRLYDPWIDASGNQINKLVTNDGNTESNNLLWLRNENSNDRNDDRFVGSFEMKYTPIEKLTFTGRAGLDFQDDKRLIENNNGTIGRLLGDFRVDNIRRSFLTVDLFGNYATDFTEDLSFNAIVGTQYNSRLNEIETLTGVQLTIPNLFSPGNVAQRIPERDFDESRLIGLYSSIEFGYKDWATLTLTARNDWSSTLPKNGNSFFYPSASLAFIFSDAFNIESDVLSFGKLRASWAQVGNDARPYALDFRYFPATEAAGQYSLNNNFPFDGRLGFVATQTIPNADLVPEETTSYEFGLDLRLFNNKIGLDISYFNSDNDNQILNIPIPQSTGFARRTVNAGSINTEGFEVAIDATPISTENFTWNTNVNFSQVESTVTELVGGVERTLIQSAFGSVQIQAIPGKEFQLWAIPFLRDEETGRPIINPTTGRRQAGDARAFGSVLPDWTGGWVNTFSYKGFTLSSTVDVSWGGIMKSATVEDLQTQGLVAETLVNREGTFIDTEGILVTNNPDGSVTRTDNNIPLRNAQDFWTSLDDASVSEAFIYDASFVKLREVALSYTLPSSIFNEKSFFKSVTLGIEGRNLALLYSKVPHIDPEANLFGSGAVGGFGVERASVPSTRSYGFNVKLRF
ncbi:SusC/RagA family TonB-linked outer membrane protein [Tenacibaculum agarivorans]|uniref:SusC/RagA family TonB-linked outer membrane protein n=1 Tax=Tenacibaculum agarivorans TaxID=1908389 RepID=UPI00094BC5F8|nr:SusC/RagA family TonB-linked outer membrane protein [Tenacibaculum agarivorans]